jgi:hypothetical protein
MKDLFDLFDTETLLDLIEEIDTNPRKFCLDAAMKPAQAMSGQVDRLGRVDPLVFCVFSSTSFPHAFVRALKEWRTWREENVKDYARYAVEVEKCGLDGVKQLVLEIVRSRDVS